MNLLPQTLKITNFSFLVVGIVRNCDRSIIDDVLRLAHCLKNTKSIRWFVVESDSTDQTVEKLKYLGEKIVNFEFTSLGFLEKKIPERTKRLAHCRNIYIKEIQSNFKYKDIDYVIVVDLDGVNQLISVEALESCWGNDCWDICTANQDGPYYDIWALRHPLWSPNDCWEQMKFFQKFEDSVEKNYLQHIYSRMIMIPKDYEWIEVDSAFGGLAIYRKELFFQSEYNGIDQNGNQCCEHVSFHEKLKASGAKIFINPKLINTSFNEHTKKLRIRQRIKRKLKCLFEIF